MGEKKIKRKKEKKLEGVGEKEKGLVALSYSSNTGAGGSTCVLRLTWVIYIETKGLSGLLRAASSHDS